ncbi:MAG: hypothetical protein ACXVHB_04905 [Solirubrobacteraceae bacterium]
MLARSRPEPSPSERGARRDPAPADTVRHGAGLLDLVAPAGNRAVGRFVRSLQRVDYTKPVADVEKTGITRLEVRGLKYGVDDFWKSYGDDASDERNKTKESPSHMAVVLVPDKLDLDKPVQVILHFHGWGFRKDDPYAGYLIAASGSSAPGGTVRDVAQEHWEQQISSLKGQGAQVVAILAQGRGKSDFGSFPTYEYVRDVLEKSARPELVKLAESENYSIVLSAHSGGGSMKVVPILSAGEADTADRSGLKPQVASKKDGRVINKLQPVDLVVLYEALNGDGDVDLVMNWVDSQLTRIVPLLQQSPDKALAATPTLRGYYGKRKKSGYRERYRWLACRIKEAIESRVPDKFRQDVADRFRIIEVAGPKGGDVEHEQVISGTGAATSGSLADALRAARNPQSDRAQAVIPDEEECKKLKERAKERARERAEAAKAAAAAKAAKAAEAQKK